MGPLDCARAIDAALWIASSLGLPADRATVVHNSNKLALRLLPCDVFARVSGPGAQHAHARFEIALARALATSGSPVAALEPRVEPRGYQRDGFDVSLWTFYEPQPTSISPADYAEALERLHAGMRSVDVPTPHFTDRVASAQQTVASRKLTPRLVNSDREMLSVTLRRLRRSIGGSGAPEQLLHGEPHPGNVISTASGPVFIDLETCCRGPSSSISPMCPTRSAGALPVSTLSCSATAGSSSSRWSPCGVGRPPISSRADRRSAGSSSTCFEPDRPGPPSTKWSPASIHARSEPDVRRRRRCIGGYRAPRRTG